MIKLEGDRLSLYQWDLNQRVILSNIAAGVEVHFEDIYKTQDCCLVVKSYEEDGVIYANIPNIFLQKSGIIIAYLYVNETSKAWTMHKTEIMVIARKKPAEYVYTETEILSYKKIAEDAIKRLDETEGFAKSAEDSANSAKESFELVKESETNAEKYANDAEQSADSAEESFNSVVDVIKKFTTEYVNPVITIEEIDNGHVVTIVASNGEHKFTILNGERGQQGIQGAQGIQGIQGPAGPKGETGKSGIIAPVNGFFTLAVDPEDGNLYAYSAAEGTTPTFEFDSATGDLYIVQELEG